MRNVTLSLCSFLALVGCADGDAFAPVPQPTADAPDPIEPSGGHPFEVLGSLSAPDTHTYNAVEWLDARYAMTTGSEGGLQIVDTVEMVVVAETGGEPGADAAYDATNQTAWLAIDKASAVARFDLSDPTLPVASGSVGGLPAADNVALAADGGLVLLGTSDDALLITETFEVVALLEAELSFGVALKNGRALVADGAELVLWDVTTPHDPVVLDAITLQGEGRSLAFDGSRVAAALGCSGVEVLDVIDDQLVSTAHIDLPDCTFEVTLDGDQLWIAAWSAVWLARLDEAVPVVLGAHPTAGSAVDVAVRDGVAAIGELDSFELVAQVSSVGGPEVTIPDKLFYPASGGSQVVELRNDGADLLDLRLTSEVYGLSGDSFLLEPGTSRTLTLTPPGTVVASSIAWSSSDPDEPAGVLEILLADDSVGEPQPPFTARAFTWPDHTLAPISYDMLEGQVVYLAFFRPSCLICTLEAPDLYAAVQGYMLDDDDFRPIWVAVEEDLEAAWAFMDEFQIGTQCILDTEGTLYGAYHSDSSEEIAVPMNVVIDRDGVVTYLSMETDITEIQAAIEAALGANAGTASSAGPVAESEQP